MEKGLTIRVMKTSKDMQRVQQLEKLVWDAEPIPIHQTMTAVKHGGLMLGAYKEDELVGFSYGFSGFSNGQTYLCSHMLGIHPDYRSTGIGKLLKEEQLKMAKEMGYELIIWTFDPLESRNAYLNSSKLYGICNKYIENCYGMMEDGLNKGLPTDRFQIDWWINSERVQEKWTPTITDYERPFEVQQSVGGNPMLQLKTFMPVAEGIEVPVPHDFQQIKVVDPELALDWRMKTRTIFKQLFAAEYALVGVNRSEGNLHHYQFIKKSTIPLSIKS